MDTHTDRKPDAVTTALDKARTLAAAIRHATPPGCIDESAARLAADYYQTTDAAARDEYERQRAELAELRAACKKMAELPEENFHGCNVGAAIRAARAATAQPERS